MAAHNLGSQQIAVSPVNDGDFDDGMDESPEIIESPMTEAERREKKRARKVQKACKKALRFFLSTAGLLVINGAYILGGGFIFEHLEKGNELANCENGLTDYTDAENATLLLLMDMATRLDNVGAKPAAEQALVRDEFQNYLRSFSTSVISAGHDVAVNCSQLGTPDGDEFAWSWAGSVVFAVTVVTTIGYGHIAPATLWGRVVCIVYAVIGIPIMLMCLGNVGDILATLFRLTYGTVCCCGCLKKDKEPEKKVDDKKKTFRLDADGKPIMEEDEALPTIIEEGDEEEEEEEDEVDLTVPLTITLSVMAGFIVTGAFLFAFWEEWDIIDAVYFCFTTLTTIGFGDLVPGTDLSDAGSILKSIGTILYIILGMALVSMCFQLMSDEVIAKFQWIGERIGARKRAREEAQQALMDENGAGGAISNDTDV